MQVFKEKNIVEKFKTLTKFLELDLKENVCDGIELTFENHCFLSPIDFKEFSMTFSCYRYQPFFTELVEAFSEGFKKIFDYYIEDSDSIISGTTINVYVNKITDNLFTEEFRRRYEDIQN